ncbi:hypothetical protein TGDOM2_401260, partial [Toxoplasma gondii GAB2-2007-GAL-DOM2]
AVAEARNFDLQARQRTIFFLRFLTWATCLLSLCGTASHEASAETLCPFIPPFSALLRECLLRSSVGATPPAPPAAGRSEEFPLCHKREDERQGRKHNKHTVGTLTRRERTRSKAARRKETKGQESARRL